MGTTLPEDVVAPARQTGPLIGRLSDACHGRHPRPETPASTATATGRPTFCVAAILLGDLPPAGAASWPQVRPPATRRACRGVDGPTSLTWPQLALALSRWRRSGPLPTRHQDHGCPTRYCVAPPL